MLIVANEYRIRFDEPLLRTMYADKRLDSVRAVQTLSRLHRMAVGKTTPFVLDLVDPQPLPPGRRANSHVTVGR